MPERGIRIVAFILYRIFSTKTKDKRIAVCQTKLRLNPILNAAQKIIPMTAGRIPLKTALKRLEVFK